MSDPFVSVIMRSFNEGYRIVYVADPVAMHSHNYTPRQAHRRSFGEARVLAAVWSVRPL